MTTKKRRTSAAAKTKTNMNRSRNHKRTGKRKPKRRIRKSIRIILYIILILSLAMMCYSGFKLFSCLHEYSVGKSVYAELRENKTETKDDSNETVTSVDFAALKEINPDIFGWIHLNDSSIDYPFVTADNNEYYLTHAFDGTETPYGTVFIDARNPDPFHDTLTVLYAHHMKDGAMFADVENYKDPSYYEDHKVIEIILEDGTYDLYPVAGRLYNGDTDYVRFNFSDEEQFNTYISGFTADSTFQSDETAAYGDQLVMLSTCSYDYDNARYVLIGKLVRKDVSGDNE